MRDNGDAMSEYRRYRRQSAIKDFIFLIIMALVLICAIFIKPVIKVMNPQTYVVTVQSKERVMLNSTQSKYLVYCLDEAGNSEVFEITDSLLKLRFDSADTYNLITPECKYEFKTGGYRVPLFSMYPNIYEIKLLSQEE